MLSIDPTPYSSHLDATWLVVCCRLVLLSRSSGCRTQLEPPQTAIIPRPSNHSAALLAFMSSRDRCRTVDPDRVLRVPCEKFLIIPVQGEIALQHNALAPRACPVLTRMMVSGVCFVLDTSSPQQQTMCVQASDAS